MQSDIGAAIGALEELLDREREMILTGHLDDLHRGEPEKVHLVTQIGASSDRAKLEIIRHKAQRNQQLLQAALQGLSAAKERIQLWVRGPNPLRTYGADGTAGEIDRPQGSQNINRRA